MFQIIAAAVAIAAVLTGYTVRTILSYTPRHRMSDLPSQEFIRSFTTPLTVPTVPKYEMAQEVSQMLHDHVQAIVADIDAALAMAQEWSQTLSVPMYVPRSNEDLDWAQIAEDSLLHTHHGVHVPTGAEFDAQEAKNIAAVVDTTVPAKKVRVYELARDCNVDSRFMRDMLDMHFGIATKSASSSVTDAQARMVVEFFATHADA